MAPCVTGAPNVVLFQANTKNRLFQLNMAKWTHFTEQNFSTETAVCAYMTGSILPQPFKLTRAALCTLMSVYIPIQMLKKKINQPTRYLMC